MAYGKFDNYDMEKLAKAKRLLMEVYDYNNGGRLMGKKVKRLETIIIKLEVLENMNEEIKR